MVDVFVSYAREDKEKTRTLAEALLSQGFSVWWDIGIRSGTPFDRIIEQQIAEARSVLVVWSHHSVDSDWVRAEANDGLNRGILVSVAIEPGLRLPLRFQNIHTENLTNWQAQEPSQSFDKVVADIKAILRAQSIGPQPPPIDPPPIDNKESITSQPESRPDKPRSPKFGLVAGFIILLIIGISWYISEVEKKNPEISKTGKLFVHAVPKNANVQILDVNQPFQQGMELKPGKYKVQVSLQGYVSLKGDEKQVESIELEANDKKTINFQLFRRIVNNSNSMEFVLIPAGSFTMGSNTWGNSVIPLRDIKFSKPFYLQTTEVNQGEWKRVMGGNPSYFNQCGDDCPVEQVSWEDVQRFIEKLNQLEKTSAYRLPSEAEWEYACRAGTTTEYSFEDDARKLEEYAWYDQNAGNKTHRVRTRKPNSWGLYDMSGNVWEWVEDDYHNDYDGAPADSQAWVDNPRAKYRVVRGGSWNFKDTFCRSFMRDNFLPDKGSYHVGFRLAKSVVLDP